MVLKLILSECLKKEKPKLNKSWVWVILKTFLQCFFTNGQQKPEFKPDQLNVFYPFQAKRMKEAGLTSLPTSAQPVFIQHYRSVRGTNMAAAISSPPPPVDLIHCQDDRSSYQPVSGEGDPATIRIHQPIKVRVRPGRVKSELINRRPPAYSNKSIIVWYIIVAEFCIQYLWLILWMYSTHWLF